MKWRKRSITCSLLAGLMALTVSGCKDKPSVKLISSQTFEFPSASGLEFYRDTLYVFGDNATHLLLLSPDYRPLRRRAYWPGNAAVIDKDEKPDIESAMIVYRNGQPALLGIGSMSTAKRWTSFEFKIGADSFTRSQLFGQETTFQDLKEINIEGSTAFGSQIVLCNRANLDNKKNHLLFWDGKDGVQLKEIRLPKTTGVAGMSGLYYVPGNDLLLFTGSEEATSSAYEDGAIGESYLGWIQNFSTAAKRNIITPDGFLQLRMFDDAFKGQKIESVCLQKQDGNSYFLHLAADNDDGKSRLFKVELKL